MPGTIDPQVLQQMATRLRDYPVTDARAAQLVADVARVNNAALAEGARNDFNDQPTRYAVVLAELARR